MLRILRFMFTGDWHICKWETVRTSDIYNEGESRPYARDYECKCDICGKIKAFRV